MQGIANRRDSSDNRRETPRATTDQQDGVTYIDRRGRKPSLGEKILKSTKWLFEVFMVPLGLAGASYFVSVAVENAQLENAQTLAEAQLKHSEALAKAQLDATEIIEQQKMHLARTTHLAKMYGEILEAMTLRNGDLAGLQARIRAMSVYEETALPFLINLREYAKLSPDASWRATSAEIDKTIVATVGVQHNIGGLQFMEKNLRKAPLQRSNLRKADFTEAKLYQADFTESDLANAIFTGADLQEAVFRYSKLDGANFDRANLRKTNFDRASLAGVDLTSARHVADAVFSTGGLGLPTFSFTDLKAILDEERQREILSLSPNFRDTTICKLWKNHRQDEASRDLIKQLFTIPSDCATYSTAEHTTGPG